jgi:hypothetical protein
MMEWLVTNELGKKGRKWLWLNFRDYPSVHLEGLRKATVKISNLWGRIWNWVVLNVTQECCPHDGSVALRFSVNIQFEGNSHCLVWGTVLAFAWETEVGGVRAEIYIQHLVSVKQACCTLDCSFQEVES